MNGFSHPGPLPKGEEDKVAACSTPVAKSLRLRLLVGVLGAVAVAWIAVAIAGYFKARHELDELLDAHLVQAASILVAQLSDDGGEIELEHVPPLHRYAVQVAFQVWERGRYLRVHSVSAPSTRLSPMETGLSTSEVDGQRWRVFSHWNREGNTLIQIGERLNAREAVSEEIAEQLLAPLALALPLLGFALALAIRRALKPLTDLTREVAMRDPQRLEAIGTARVPSEIRPLVNQLNTLFRRIVESLENERRFTADASHELRTPIAAIRAQAQVAREAADTEERIHALDKVLAGCDRAIHLTEQLLILARLDAGTWRTPSTGCDLAAAAQAVLAELGQQAYSRRVSLELISAGPVPVACDETLLRVLLRNLIDNAIRYSPRSTAVTVWVGADAVGGRLEINDQGPGIASEERQRVLDRFYRVLGTEAPGSGLGLSIVTRIAALYGAQLSLADGDGRRGLKVTILFTRPASR